MSEKFNSGTKKPQANKILCYERKAINKTRKIKAIQSLIFIKFLRNYININIKGVQFSRKLWWRMLRENVREKVTNTANQ